LTGAADAQISVKRDPRENIPQGDQIVSRLEPAEVGVDEGGQAITSCIVIQADLSMASGNSESFLTPNQQTMFSILHAAGDRGLALEEWNEQTRDAGIGVKRPATLLDIRIALKSKGLIQETYEWVDTRTALMDYLQRGRHSDNQLYRNHQIGGPVVQAKSIAGRTQRTGLWPLRNWRRGLTASHHGSETDEGKTLPGTKQRSGITSRVPRAG
jgi:hypothetical protein